MNGEPRPLSKMSESEVGWDGAAREEFFMREGCGRVRWH
jgi:hypothetical protein